MSSSPAWLAEAAAVGEEVDIREVLFRRVPCLGARGACSNIHNLSTWPIYCWRDEMEEGVAHASLLYDTWNAGRTVGGWVGERERRAIFVFFRFDSIPGFFSLNYGWWMVDEGKVEMSSCMVFACVRACIYWRWEEEVWRFNDYDTLFYYTMSYFLIAICEIVSFNMNANICHDLDMALLDVSILFTTIHLWLPSWRTIFTISQPDMEVYGEGMDLLQSYTTRTANTHLVNKHSSRLHYLLQNIIQSIHLI